MRYRSLFRALMIVVGITATFAIILSQALPEISEPLSEKIKTEQTEQEADLKVLSTPPDVVPGGVIQMNDVDRSFLETLINEERGVSQIQCYTYILSEYFKILFRVIISPNAP